jgi:hypothetical protein
MRRSTDGFQDVGAASLAASLATAERREQPYRNWRLQRVLPELLVRQLAEIEFAPVELAGLSGRRELHNDGRYYFAGELLERYPVMRAVAEIFQSPDVVKMLAAETGADLAGAYLRIEYALDVEGFWLEPHTDLGVKALTLLLQLPAERQEDLGTDLFADQETWSDRAAFDWNGGLLFIPSDRTWHGFRPRRIIGVRRSVIINYVTDEWRAREQLAFATSPVGP